MMALGFFAYLVACGLAWLAVWHPRGRWVVLGALALFALLYGAPLLIDWAQSGLAPFSDKSQVQIGVIGVYAFTIALIPAGIARQIPSRHVAPVVALGLAVLWPALCFAVAGALGRSVGVVSSGWGSLGELLFLNPIELGEGVTNKGFIPHRFRVHHLGMLGMLALGVFLQLLPAPRVDRAKPRPATRAR